MSKKIDEILSHSGVLGMKWGRRKRRDGTYGPTKQVVKEENTLKNKPQNRRMTDSELRSLINRIEMEKKYEQLISANTKKSDSFVKDFLKKNGTQIASNVSVALGTAYLSRALNVKVNAKLPEAYRVPIKGKK